MDKLIQAQKKPACVFASNLQFYDSMSHVQAIRQLARLSVVELFAAQSEGDYEKAHLSLARTLRVSRDLRPRGSMISQLMSNAVDATTLTTAAALTLSQPGLTVENCDQLIGLLVTHEQTGLDQLQEGLRIEYIVARNTFQKIRTPFMGHQYLVTLLGEGDADRVLTPEQFARVNWKAELAACDRIYGTLLSNVGKSQVELPNGWGKELREQLQAQDTNLMAMLAIDTDQMFEAVRRRKARVMGLIGLSAVRRYQLAHGKLPTDLAIALQEAKLTDPLQDPYTDKSMLYAVVNSKPVVYSVGSDLIDQGGKVDWKYGQQPGDFVLKIGE
ncbi:MAG: hypothetical protein NTZ32_21720 [Planctomycetales bacterium]|nr:hypothetical protein [Planctomycetales bacterium]